MATRDININSMEELMLELKRMTLVAMREVGEEAKVKVKSELSRLVYNKSASDSIYKRTGDLMESVTYKVTQDGRETLAEIYHNPNLITAVAPYQGNNYIGQHYSTSPRYNPQDYSKYVAETVNDGTSGNLFGEGYWRKPRPYFTNAETYIQSNFTKIFQRAFKNIGINLK